MIKIVIHTIKFIIIGLIIAFGLSFYDKLNPIYLQNIVFWILVFIPCVGAYESIFSRLMKKAFAKYIQENKASKKPSEKTFQEKLSEKINQK
ncbi:MAG: hypothetical protein V4683_11940 [Bacteroidota bacterium]